jgi:hypothetical protein
MRRIYHKFPQRCDLVFDLDRPLPDVIQCITRMHNTHTTRKKGEDLLKLSMMVEVADQKTRMVPVDNFPNLHRTVTEAADFRITYHETLLTPDQKVPVSVNQFLFRVSEVSGGCECFALKENAQGSLDSMDLKQLISGACG